MIRREDIQYRVSRVTKNGAIFLIYIDARTCARELDEQYGKLNWQFSWEKEVSDQWAIKGKLKVYNPEIKEWVEYQDVGYPNEAKTYEGEGADFQWMKDAVSDSLKRCGVQANVGRELYDAPFLYTEECEWYEKDGQKRFKKLYPLGEKMIEGNIDKWYQKLSILNLKKEKNGISK